jgi:hypothetical protein
VILRIAIALGSDMWGLTCAAHKEYLLPSMYMTLLFFGPYLDIVGGNIRILSDVGIGEQEGTLLVPDGLLGKVRMRL